MQALAAAADPAEEKARQDRAKAPPPQQQTKGSLDQYRVGGAPPKKVAPESWADDALAKRVASVRASAGDSTFTVLKDLEAALRDRTAALASLQKNYDGLHAICEDYHGEVEKLRVQLEGLAESAEAVKTLKAAADGAAAAEARARQLAERLAASEEQLRKLEGEKKTLERIKNDQEQQIKGLYKDKEYFIKMNHFEEDIEKYKKELKFKTLDEKCILTTTKCSPKFNSCPPDLEKHHTLLIVT